MKILDVVILGLSFASLGYFAGAFCTLLYTHRNYWLTPKEK